MMQTSRGLARDIAATGMTQAEIAERVGTTQATISKLTRGEISDISYALGKRLEALHKERAAVICVNAPSQHSGHSHPATDSTPAD